ncbi:hypothetical protein IWX65_001118 [Arthrobacter sp. CAN_A214]
MAAVTRPTGGAAGPTVHRKNEQTSQSPLRTIDRAVRATLGSVH